MSSDIVTLPLKSCLRSHGENNSLKPFIKRDEMAVYREEMSLIGEWIPQKKPADPSVVQKASPTLPPMMRFIN